EGGPGLSLAEPCLASPATFTVTLEGVSVVDPEGDPITYTVTGTPNAGDPVQATDIPSFPYSGPPTGPWSSPPVTNVRFTGFANDPLHPAAEGTPLIPDSGVVGTVGSAPFVRTVGGGLGDLGYAVSTDNAGNILVAGVFRGTVDFDPGPGSSPRTSQGEWDGFVAKFDAGGQFLWVASWGGENYDEAFAAEADPEGNVFVTGRFSSTTVDFDPGPGEEPRTNSGGYDCYAVRLDPTGNLQWAAAWGGGGNDKSTGLALDPRGAPHMAGSFIGTVDFDPGAGTVERTSGGGSDDSFLLKLDPETGAFADLLTLGNDVSDYAEDVEFDSAGNLVLAGIFQTTMDFDPGPDVQNRTAVGFSPYLLKLDPRFSYTWVAALGVSSSLGLTFHGLDIDPTDAVYLGSEFSIGTDFDAGPGVEPRAPVGATDAFVVKYDSMGSFQWVAAVGGGGGDWGRGVAADGEAVYLAGEFNNTVDFDPGAGSAPLTSAGSGDAYLLKLTAAGEYVWASRWGAGQQDLAYDVSLRAGCDPLTTGTFQGLVDFDPGAGTSEVSAVGSFDAFLLKLRGDTGTL
ncbi:MAG TPA: hypothetical protein VEI97_21205, partial [bacterium]|nr:hypothetical protein [bacterium]